MQENHCDCPRVAQHALVLGSGGHVQSNPTKPARCAQPIDTALQSDPSQKSDKPKSQCMAPRALAIKEQGFSEAVAARIEAPQRGSTRSVYEAKWTIFTKWCLTNKVDFRAPPVKSVADFLMYLFQDRKLVIPALAPTLDRSLCPVRALRYYLDRTSDLRRNKELVFVSFKKGFDKDISPATIYSWIKQTVILCSQTMKPSPYIRLKPMMSGLLQLPKPSSQESHWNKYYQPATGNHTTPSPSST